MIKSEQTNPPEARLLWEKMRSGDNKALADLFKSFYSFLYDYGMKLSNQSELVKDSIQEVFSYVWEKRETISKVNSVSAYMLVSLRRQVIKSLKQQQLKQDIYQEFSQYYPVQAFSAEDILIKNEETDAEKKLLQQALDNIPPRVREALYLKTYQGLCYKDIAVIMKISSQVARNYVSEAFHRLRVLLTEVESIY